MTCDCSLNGRCLSHGQMMKEIHHVWTHSLNNDELRELWAWSDGYGTPGYVPPQGYDWSGIRDSTPAAVEEMYAAAVLITAGWSLQ